MRLLTHVLAADARRFRVAIALWIVIVIAETVVQHLGTLVTPYTREAEAIATAGWLLWMSGVFVSCALVPLIVHLHPAVGSDAFWMTRPIPPRTLAAAKLLLSAAVFVGVPLLADQFVMAIYDVPGGDRLRVVAQTTIMRGVVLALLIAAAVLTPNFASFALLCGGVLFGLAIVLPFVTIIIAALQPRAPSFSVFVESSTTLIRAVAPPSLPSAALVAAAVVVLGGIAAVVVQYRSRRAWIAAALVAVSIPLAVAAGFAWPVVPPDRPAPDWASAPGAVDLIALPSDVRVLVPSPLAEGRAGWGARVPVRMIPAAPGWVASARLQRASLELDGGARYATQSDSYNVLLTEPGGALPHERALHYVLGVRRLVNVHPQELRNESVLTLQLRDEDLTRTPTRAATFQSEFRVDIARLEIAAAMPVGRGEYQDGAFHFTVFEVRDTPSGVILRSRISAVSTFLDAVPRPGYSFYLRNHRRNEAVVGLASEHREHVFVPFFGVSSEMSDGTGFQVSAQSVVFSAGSHERVPPFEMDRQWLDQAELVIVRAAYAGSVRRRLVIENFPVTPTRAGS